MSAIIQLNGVSAAGKLADITLDVAAGEVVALAGSRGSGKSTLIRILAGQMLPTSGTVTIGGVDCRNEACRRLVGVAGEAWGLYERLTVLENLAITARLWGVPGHSIADVLKRVELNGLEQRRADKLQAGEAARLRLARALLHDPAALLLDEPMGDIERTPRMPHVAARNGERVLLYRPEEIRYAYAQEKAVFIQTADGPCAVSLTLSDLEERLADQGFFRCHRAFLVNVDWVKELVTWTRDSYSLILKDGKDVPLSKHRAPELKARLSL